MPLFEVAILETPTKKEAEEGKSEKLIMAPKPVVANDEQSAAVIIAMEQKDIVVDKSRMVVLVRPFVSTKKK